MTPLAHFLEFTRAQLLRERLRREEGLSYRALAWHYEPLEPIPFFYEPGLPPMALDPVLHEAIRGLGPDATGEQLADLLDAGWRGRVYVELVEERPR